ncbi:MAG TPA: 4-hydroxy-tetrahydrodipicolinate reductase [Bacteroidota bacterium]|nr:4-hydroxy-tetrahydrodipicolinate reductase [Bacteroidota bacterium]
MNIALIGNGKMGAEVERVALAKGIAVKKIFTEENNRGGRGLTAESLRGIDVCVEFTLPAAAVKNIEAVAKAGKPIVVGTTGWYDDLDAVRKIVETAKTGLVYSPNFSIGVNLFAHLLNCAAHLFDRYEMYDVAIRETHHRGKADSPSGTALHLSQLLIKNIRRKTSILAGNATGAIKQGQLHISSQRVGHAVGEHAVVFDSEADSLEFVHRTKNRSGFAHGALIAAGWIRDRQGVYTMEDVLATE